MVKENLDLTGSTAETTKTQRRTVPLGAYFILTAIVAFVFAIIRLSFPEDETGSWEELGKAAGGGGMFGALLGGGMGLFDVPRSRGLLLGAVAGLLIGATVSVSFTLPLHKLSLAIHLANASAILIVGFAIAVRWNR
jgi:hypothetical protein